MAKQSKIEKKLQAKAQELYFNKYPSLGYMYATEDGNFFYPNHLAAAQRHGADTNSKVFALERDGGAGSAAGSSEAHPGAGKTGPAAGKSVKALQALYKDLETKEDFDAFVISEGINDKDDRKGVRDLFAKAKADFKAEAEVSDQEVSKLVATILDAKSEEELDQLDDKYNLSQSKDPKIAAAFKSKEDEFLGE